MPYTSIKELPSNVRNYDEVVQRQWLHVFNTVYEKENDESRAFMAANSVLKKRFSGESMMKNSREDYFTHLVDRWLGNLQG